MTCGTHTTANVTAAAFGFNPLLSGSFLKRRDSCECTICSLFRSYHPCRVQRGPGQRHRHTDCHCHLRSLSFSFFQPFFFPFFFFFAFFSASWPTDRSAVRARWTRRSWCPLCALLWRPWEACCLNFVTFSWHHPSAPSSRRARLLPIRTASSVCVYVCVHVCVCIYI